MPAPDGRCKEEGLAAWRQWKEQGGLNSLHLSTGDSLVRLGQAHLFAKWPVQTNSAQSRTAFLDHVAKFSWDEGITGYCNVATQVMVNTDPLNGEIPRPAEVVDMQREDEQFIELEDMARLNASGDANGEGGMAIVLVAGGMGQRLSYQGGGIVSKVQIPLDLLTKTTFMEQYCGWIKAIELASNAHHGRSEASYLNIPFFIMTSAETHEGIRSFMTTNFCFGLEPTQIIYAQQPSVPAFFPDTKAGSIKLIRDDNGEWPTLLGKPGGHGAVHSLIHTSPDPAGLLPSLAHRWAQEKRIVAFLQDGNASSVQAVLPGAGQMLRGNPAHHAEFVFLACDREPGSKVGALMSLEGSGKTLNIEYNILPAALAKAGLKDSRSCGTDLGNSNIFLIRATAMRKVYEKTGGIVQPIVNSTKGSTVPTGVELLMQAFSEALGGSTSARKPVFVCKFRRATVFRRLSNGLANGRKISAASGWGPEQRAMFADTLPNAEAAYYLRNRQKLRQALGPSIAHVSLRAKPPLLQVQGIYFESGARIVLDPSWAVTHTDIRNKFLGKRLTISDTSAIAIRGPGVVFDSTCDLSLSGAAFFVAAGKNTRIEFRGKLSLPINDKQSLDEGPFRLFKFDSEDEGSEFSAGGKTAAGHHFEFARGYKLERLGGKGIILCKPGVYNLKNAVHITIAVSLPGNFVVEMDKDCLILRQLDKTFRKTAVGIRKIHRNQNSASSISTPASIKASVVAIQESCQLGAWEKSRTLRSMFETRSNLFRKGLPERVAQEIEHQLRDAAADALLAAYAQDKNKESMKNGSKNHKSVRQSGKIAKEVFSMLFGASPDAVARGRQRQNGGGAHTDWMFGSFWGFSIDMSTLAAVRILEPQLDGEKDKEELYCDLYGHDLDAGRRFRRVYASQQDTPLPRDHKLAWTNYILGTVDQMRKRGVGVPHSFQVYIIGNSIQRKGLSSSAAIENAVGLAILAAAGNSMLSPDVAKHKREVAQAGNDAENYFVNVGSGILDQGSSMFKQMAVFRYVNGQLNIHSVRLPVQEVGVTSVVIDSGSDFPLASTEDIDSLPLAGMPNHFKCLSLFNRRVMAFSLGRALMTQLPLNSTWSEGRVKVSPQRMQQLRESGRLPGTIAVFDVKYSGQQAPEYLWSANPFAKTIPSSMMDSTPTEKASWLRRKIGQDRFISAPLSRVVGLLDGGSQHAVANDWQPLTVLVLRDELDLRAIERRPHTLQYVVVGLLNQKALNELVEEGVLDPGDVGDNNLAFDVFQYSVNESTRTDLLFWLLSGRLYDTAKEDLALSTQTSATKLPETREAGDMETDLLPGQVPVASLGSVLRNNRRMQLALMVEKHARMQEKKGLYERAKYERGIASFLRDLMVRSEGRELTEGQLVYTVGALGDLSWQDKLDLFHGDSTFKPLSTVDCVSEFLQLPSSAASPPIKQQGFSDEEEMGFSRVEEETLFTSPEFRVVGTAGLGAGWRGVHGKWIRRGPDDQNLRWLEALVTGKGIDGDCKELFKQIGHERVPSSYVPVAESPNLLRIPREMKDGHFNKDAISIIVTSPQNGSGVLWMQNNPCKVTKAWQQPNKGIPQTANIEVKVGPQGMQGGRSQGAPEAELEKLKDALQSAGNAIRVEIEAWDKIMLQLLNDQDKVSELTSISGSLSLLKSRHKSFDASSVDALREAIAECVQQARQIAEERMQRERERLRKCRHLTSAFYHWREATIAETHRRERQRQRVKLRQLEAALEGMKQMLAVSEDEKRQAERDCQRAEASRLKGEGRRLGEQKKETAKQRTLDAKLKAQQACEQRWMAEAGRLKQQLVQQRASHRKEMQSAQDEAALRYSNQKQTLGEKESALYEAREALHRSTLRAAQLGDEVVQLRKETAQLYKDHGSLAALHQHLQTSREEWKQWSQETQFERNLEEEKREAARLVHRMQRASWEEQEKEWQRLRKARMEQDLKARRDEELEEKAHLRRLKQHEFLALAFKSEQRSWAADRAAWQAEKIKAEQLRQIWQETERDLQERTQKLDEKERGFKQKGKRLRKTGKMQHKAVEEAALKLEEAEKIFASRRDEVEQLQQCVLQARTDMLEEQKSRQQEAVAWEQQREAAEKKYTAAKEAFAEEEQERESQRRKWECERELEEQELQRIAAAKLDLTVRAGNLEIKLQELGEASDRRLAKAKNLWRSTTEAWNFEQKSREKERNLWERERAAEDKEREEAQQQYQAWIFRQSQARMEQRNSWQEEIAKFQSERREAEQQTHTLKQQLKETSCIPSESESLNRKTWCSKSEETSGNASNKRLELSAPIHGCEENSHTSFPNKEKTCTKEIKNNDKCATLGKRGNEKLELPEPGPGLDQVQTDAKVFALQREIERQKIAFEMQARALRRARDLNVENVEADLTPTAFMYYQRLLAASVPYFPSQTLHKSHSPPRTLLDNRDTSKSPSPAKASQVRQAHKRTSKRSQHTPPEPSPPTKSKGSPLRLSALLSPHGKKGNATSPKKD